MRIKLILFFLFISQFILAQNISGVIQDAETGAPLIGANILLQGDPSTVSDINGDFSLGIGRGNYSAKLYISYTGYEQKIIPFSLKEEDIDLGVIKLVPKTYVLLNNQVVITAQRSEHGQFESMEAVSVLQGSQILANGSRSMAEALIGMPGVWMQKTNHGGGSPFVRGLTGNQTLLLLDGIRLNNATYRYGPNQYFNTLDPLNVDRVEVVRGAGSVLYGSDALGGVVQVFMQTPNFSSGGWKFGGNLLAKALTDDQEYTGRVKLNLANEKVAIGAGMSYRDFGDLVAGGDLGAEAPSSYDEFGVDFKSLFKISPSSVLTLAYNGLFQSEVGRYDQVAQRGYQLYQFNPQNRQMAYAKLENTIQKPWLDSYKLIASYQNSLEGREKQRQNSRLLAEEEDEVNTLGFILEGVSKLNKNWKMVSGLEYYHDKVNSRDQDRNLETGNISTNRGLYPDGATANNLALFNSHTLEVDKWSFNLGWRLNLITLEIQDATFGNTSISPLAMVGNFSTRYEPKPNQALIAAINTGFRAPNINDLSSFGSFDFGIEVPSRDLSPERSLTYEIAYKVKSKNLGTGIALYHTQLFDLISRVPGTFQGSSSYQGEDVYQKENLAKSYIQGTEFDLEWAFNRHWNLQGSMIYTYGQNTDKDEPMRRIPPLNGSLALKRIASNWNAQLIWLFAGKQERLSGGDISDHRIADGGTPAWNVLNLNFEYQFDKLNLKAGLSNIFNEAYRIHGSGVDGMGRAAWISVGYNW